MPIFLGKLTGHPQSWGAKRWNCKRTADFWAELRRPELRTPPSPPLHFVQRVLDTPVETNRNVLQKQQCPITRLNFCWVPCNASKLRLRVWSMVRWLMARRNTLLWVIPASWLFPDGGFHSHGLPLYRWSISWEIQIYKWMRTSRTAPRLIWISGIQFYPT